jgi:hypothetical protein
VQDGLGVTSGSNAREAQEVVRFPARRATPEPSLPDRYRIKGDGTGAVLSCVEAPTISVRLQHGFTVTAAAARSAAPGSIFLDGAAQGQPFINPKREVYNLDHHEGCIRSFLLATCEQAMVLIRKGLDLRKREWTVYANDADLDTVLAIWVLLNHLRLNEPETRERVMPLVRLQGVIDAQGLDMLDMSALPPELVAETQARIDELREPELALKQRGRWGEADLLGYTADRLRAIDRLVYSPTHFDDVTDVEQLARVGIAKDSVAVVCRSKAGIYEVERQLRRLHGKRLGVIVLRTGAATYTLRQVNPYLPTSLERVYTQLNLVDPAAGGHRSANRWGGSTEIGGSPRSTGTRLSPEEIAGVCQRAFRPPTVVQRLRRIAGAALGSAGILLVALASVFLPVIGRGAGAPTGLAGSAAQFSVLLATLGGAFLLIRGLRAPGLYGLRRPAGLSWCVLLPFAVFGALVGGVWIPVSATTPAPWLQPLGILALPLAAEVIFRGLFHGGLVTSFAILECAGPWLLSCPVILSAGFYALWGAILRHPAISLTQPIAGGPASALPVLGALLFGAASGMARERSESLTVSILLHWIGVVAVLLAPYLVSLT